MLALFLYCRVKIALEIGFLNIAGHAAVLTESEWAEGSMILDLTNLEKALSQLEKSLNYLNSDLARNDSDLRDQFRGASIQAFAFTYELAIKLLRRQLEQIVPSPAELRAMAFMDLVRTGAEAGLVDDVARYRLYRERRNLTSHTYDEERAEEVLSALEPFVADVHHLLTELKRRNPSDDAH